MFNKILKNKKAQTGETVTWIVATVIIVVILFFSVFIVSVYFGDGKKFFFTKQADSLASKSFFSYLLTKDNEGKIIYEQLKNEQNPNEFNIKLASKIFQEFYKKEYFNIRIAIISSGPVLTEFSHLVKYIEYGDAEDVRYITGRLPVYNNIPLNENKSISMILQGQDF
ncbi:MAG: hypothetical protein ABIH65_02150 [Nanoarchaeota archaeon]